MLCNVCQKDIDKFNAFHTGVNEWEVTAKRKGWKSPKEIIDAVDVAIDASSDDVETAFTIFLDELEVPESRQDLTRCSSLNSVGQDTTRKGERE